MALVSRHSKSPHLSPQSKALSANAYGEQRENKHTNLETARESHGNNRQEEKENKADEEVDICSWSRRASGEPGEVIGGSLTVPEQGHFIGALD